MKQFLCFCIVGTLGFFVDAGALQALVSGVDANPYAARVASFLTAASVTWWLNRRYTFAAEHRATRAEWVRYVSFMILGAVTNYSAYAATIALWEVARNQLWLGVAIGSIAGLGVNFMTSRAIVFPDRNKDASRSIGARCD